MYVCSGFNIVLLALSVIRSTKKTFLNKQIKEQII